MATQKDRHLETPGEANRDKHINFVAEENGDVDPADDNSTGNENDAEEGDDNGFFTDDDNQLQTKEEHDATQKIDTTKNEKVTPLVFDDAPTLGDKINLNADNEDILTAVVNDNNKPYAQDDDQAH